MHQYKELIVWQKAIELVTEVYRLTKKFPADERFGLVLQINRRACSVPSNIAEGAGRNTNGEFIHFLGIANGSCFELETQLTIAERLGFLEKQEFLAGQKMMDEVQRMIFSLQKKLKKNNK